MLFLIDLWIMAEPEIKMEIPLEIGLTQKLVMLY
jgi:hypothetical protein